MPSPGHPISSPVTSRTLRLKRRAKGYIAQQLYMFFLSLSIVLFDLDNFLFVQARLVVVHLIFFLLGRNPPTATFGHFLAPSNG
jgi:hypothetical protein